jgi:uncharacterized tellurite resistance protein B-like protein
MLSFLSGVDVFNQYSNKDAIKNILAVIMIAIVNADQKVTQQEKRKILDLFKLEFGIDEEETIDFFTAVEYNNTAFNSSLVNLKTLLNEDVMTKAKVLQHLNTLIICDGCVDEEYEVFDKIREFLL